MTIARSGSRRFSGAAVRGAWFDKVKDLIIIVSGSMVNGLSVVFTTALVVEALYPGRVTGTVNPLVEVWQQHQELQSPERRYVSIPNSRAALLFVERWDNAVRPDWHNWPEYKLDRVDLLAPPKAPQRVAVQPPQKRLHTPRQERPVLARRYSPQYRPSSPGVAPGGTGFGFGFR
jgi:hypothetical protein